jgi:hypothetical protein
MQSEKILRRSEMTDIKRFYYITKKIKSKSFKKMELAEKIKWLYFYAKKTTYRNKDIDRVISSLEYLEPVHNHTVYWHDDAKIRGAALAVKGVEDWASIRKLSLLQRKMTFLWYKIITASRYYEFYGCFNEHYNAEDIETSKKNINEINNGFFVKHNYWPEII